MKIPPHGVRNGFGIVCLYQPDVEHDRHLVTLGHAGRLIHYDLVDDWSDVIPVAKLVMLVDEALDCLSAGADLYVHCYAGISRSSYFNCALLMRHFRIPFESAYAEIVAAHPVADPNRAFRAQLIEQRALFQANSRR